MEVAMMDYRESMMNDGELKIGQMPAENLTPNHVLHSILNPASSILKPPSFILNPQSSILYPRSSILWLSLVMLITLLPIGCRDNGSRSRQLTMAVNSGVEGDALKQAARDYEARSGVHINIAEFPYDNLFEKELVDLTAGSGAYDLIMLDDPWFPRFAVQNVLADLAPFYKKRGEAGPDSDFVPSSLALCKHPYETGSLFALPYVGNSQLFFYRKDLFEKHNLTPPASWEDVMTAAKTIDEKERTGSPDGNRVYGYVMR